MKRWSSSSVSSGRGWHSHYALIDRRGQATLGDRTYELRRVIMYRFLSRGLAGGFYAVSSSISTRPIGYAR